MGFLKIHPVDFFPLTPWYASFMRSPHLSSPTSHPHLPSVGFTLIEVILYAAILAMLVGLFAGTITLTTRVQVHERASTELANQLNFTMQTIQRLIREASVVIVSDNLGSACASASDADESLQGTALHRCLKLRLEAHERPRGSGVVGHEDNGFRQCSPPALTKNCCEDHPSSR